MTNLGIIWTHIFGKVTNLEKSRLPDQGCVSPRGGLGGQQPPQVIIFSDGGQIHRHCVRNKWPAPIWNVAGPIVTR